MTAFTRALIADDHSITRRGLAELLRDVYPTVVIGEADDALSTLEKVGEERWDILLLDAMMPGSEGMELTRAIRAIAPALPILMITAAVELEYVLQAMNAGVNGLIHKHRAGDEMVEAIRQVASGETYLHPDTALQIAQDRQSRKAAPPHERLSHRELEIFRGLARGRAVKEIAGDLGISAKTVATYVARIRQKTGLGSYVDITRYALHHAMVD
jgi:DNA-binding NarL/FixJ family response regulator